MKFRAHDTFFIRKGWLSKGMGTNGITTMKKRLQVSLTEIFEQLYPQTISFNFDGLLTASNNFTGKGSTYFCQIVKMLLSNNVNYDTIHDFTSDVRSKITAVLRACLKSPGTPSEPVFSRPAALKMLGIHPVFLRFFPCRAKKSRPIRRTWRF